MTTVVETVSKTQKQIDEETKERYWQKVRQAIKRSKESLKDIPEPEEPTYDQKEWFIRKMKRSKL